MYKVVYHPLPPIASLRPDLPTWVSWVVEKACVKDPAGRYQSAREILDHLESAGSGLPTVVQGGGAATTGEGAAYPQKEILPTSGGSDGPYSMETITGAPHPSTLIRPYEPIAASHARPPRHRPLLPILLVAVLIALLAGGGVAAYFFLSSSRDGTSKKQVAVPDLKSLSWEQARSRLEEVGLITEKKEVTSTGKSEGTVIAQSPAAGQYLEKGGTVTIEVAGAGSGSASATSSYSTYTSTPSYFSGQSLSTYTNTSYGYSISYPSNWRKQEGPVSYGYRARFDSPDGKAYIVVDTSPEQNGDPGSWALSQNRQRQSSGWYSCKKLEYSSFKGWTSFIWEFSDISSENDFHPGIVIYKYDYFINTRNMGFAVMFCAVSEAYGPNLNGFMDNVLNSLRI
jgi:flagellar basal body-associated protein FliL